MSSSTATQLLIVDTSPSMAEVLKTFAIQNNFSADVFSDPALACQSLDTQSRNGSVNYQCALLGWPDGKIGMITDLLGKLGAKQYENLPLVIVCDKETYDLRCVAKRRSKTRILLWREYRKLARLVGELALNPVAQTAPLAMGTSASGPAFSTAAMTSAVAKKILLVDNSPSVCSALRDLLEVNGYHVSIASTADEAHTAIRHNHFDLVVTDFFLGAVSAESFCQELKAMDAAPTYLVMTAKNLDNVIQKSLSVGAITCLDKNESTEILYARIDAIVRGLPGKSVGTEKSDTVEAASASLASLQSVSVAAESSVFVPLKGLLEMLSSPALLINEEQQIVALNRKASRMLSNENNEKIVDPVADKLVNSSVELVGKSLTDDIFRIKINTDVTDPVVTSMKDVNGEEHLVSYEVKSIDSESLGLRGAHHLLSFDLIHAQYSDKAEPATQIQVESEAPTTAVRMSSAAELMVAIESAGNRGCSVLRMDIKMIATVTEDRISLGQSALMLEMVMNQLLQHNSEQCQIAHLGNGKFAALMTSGSQALKDARDLVKTIPTMVNYLSDVKLVSHNSFVQLAAGESIATDILMKHCKAACIKTEAEGRDNAIFVINSEMLVVPKNTFREVPRGVLSKPDYHSISSMAEKAI